MAASNKLFFLFLWDCLKGRSCPWPWMRRPPGTLIEASEPAYPFDGGLTLPSTPPWPKLIMFCTRTDLDSVLSLKI
ncbi:hypothetical protein ACSS6W_004680 [Trichoderma asperelloides]|uniref:Secreted protein n=1 Tax=Trichoderma asperellum (strain ATCC 204424 / CBS 433.97 / NBRC 101777) TaxID=1042311 RepID=A0A2T3Z7L1_TRIA4|nr:hypothetical protein M441DRAFT_69205 [Trichoderma asperellum CBS 433.97]PTB40772.1 hypothetical protein M441DRAFT_69205 [Trichoderma asperellum CBS 433.97]